MSARNPVYVRGDLDVYEAARERIRWLFDEFDNRVSVATSGGKDSTVVLELAAQVARERGVLPIDAWWIDQECEYAATVEYQRYVMYERDDVHLRWYQIPFRLENATDLTERFLNVWGEGEEWVREKEPDSIHENTYGKDLWYGLLSAVNRDDWDGCHLDGMRVEESPTRRLTMTTTPVYKWVTWSRYQHRGGGKATGPGYRFSPIWDWSYRDVWKFIHDHDLRYNRMYDVQFQYGIPVRRMRVSNYHHDQALHSLTYLQEAEPETWAAATRRLQGINAYGHLHTEQIPKQLPYMFASWEEYLHYLIDHLIPEEDGRKTFRKQFDTLVRTCPWVSPETCARESVRAVITGDYYGVRVRAFQINQSAKRPAEVLDEQTA